MSSVNLQLLSCSPILNLPIHLSLYFHRQSCQILNISKTENLILNSVQLLLSCNYEGNEDFHA